LAQVAALKPDLVATGAENASMVELIVSAIQADPQTWLFRAIAARRLDP
jgi:hypothetical protein